MHLSLNVLEPAQTEMDLQLFATLSAIKGTQFGREVYSSVILFKDLDKFLATFPNVQRQINPRKVNSIKRYILNGLESEEEMSMRFFSAVTVSCRGIIFYDDSTKRMAINTNECKLSINDGQHRIEAINKTLNYLEQEYVKSKDKIKSQKIRRKIDMLKDMIVPVIIFDGLTERHEKMLFHDLNNLAQRPSKNVNIKMNQVDLFSKMAMELAEENRYLKHYGIETDKMSIQEGNPNSILLSTLYESIKELVNFKENHYVLSYENFDSAKKMINETFDKLFYVLPPDLNVKGKYLLEKSYALKSISRFINEARNHLLMIEDERIFEIIKNMDWGYNPEFWRKFGAVSGKGENLVFPGGGYGAAKAVYQALVDQINE